MQHVLQITPGFVGLVAVLLASLAPMAHAGSVVTQGNDSYDVASQPSKGNGYVDGGSGLVEFSADTEGGLRDNGSLLGWGNNLYASGTPEGQAVMAATMREGAAVPIHRSPEGAYALMLIGLAVVIGKRPR